MKRRGYRRRNGLTGAAKAAMLAVDMKRLFPILLAVFLHLCAIGQPVQNAATATPLEALKALSIAVDTKAAEVQALRAELQAADNEVEQKVIADDLQAQVAELRNLRLRFEESASGVDISQFEETEKEAFSWQNQLGKILEPVIDEMETATARSRKMAGLRKDIQLFGERNRLAEEAVARIRSHLAATQDPVLANSLQRELERWQQRRVLAGNQQRAAQVQLQSMEAEETGGFRGVAPYIRGFLSQRGLNLLYGIGTALLVFFGVRMILVLRQRIRRGDDPNSFSSRVFVLLTNFLSIAGALAALLIVFSAAGDLFLLGLVLIFLIGVAWAGIRVIPQFIESLKIILNIGMVRENQRILFDGIPWNIEALGFVCRLVNRELDDGQQLLPAKRLVGLHSRPWCADEEPFPVRRGEWVALSDGHAGRTVAQNPATVTIEELGGATITYPTPEFLQLAPRNLSRGSFRVHTRFGIDYRHQAAATTEIVELFQKHLEQKLPEAVDRQAILGVSVQFAHAGRSSLDYHVEARLAGTAADLKERVEFALQRILVEACNQHGLSIPFTQVTVHQAAG
jgi:hypothetical protein